MLRSAFPNKGFPLRVLSASAVIHPTFFHRRDTERTEVERFFMNHSFLRLLSALRGELSRIAYGHRLGSEPIRPRSLVSTRTEVMGSNGHANTVWPTSVLMNLVNCQANLC